MASHPWKKLGKRPPKHDARNLKLARYLTPELPAPPPKIDHASKVPTWPMYKNDTYGDCGPAGAGHQTQSWSYSADRGVTPTETAIVQDYFRITGGVDSGVYLLDMMNYWRKNGIAGDTIEAFVQADVQLTQAKLAIQLFGSLGIGMSLPDVNTFGPWTDVTGPPNPNNGHYVCAVGYDDARQMFKVVTWGELVDMSYAWFLKYVDEAYAALNDLSLIQSTMQTPEGFDFATLQDDLSHLGDPVTPPDQPPPPPSPTPSSPWKWVAIVAVALLLVGVVVALVSCHTSPPAPSQDPLPDSHLTPGALAPWGSDTSVVCHFPLPPRNVPTWMHDAAYTEYHVAADSHFTVQVDHLIPREAGGGDSLRNLWAEPIVSAHRKDSVENWVHTEICSGAIPLRTAQQQMAKDWTVYYWAMHS